MSRHFGALHGLAIVIVVFYHSIEFGMAPPFYDSDAPAQEWITYFLLAFKQLGIFAVPTFLFISGCFFSYAARRYDSIRSMGKMVRNGLSHLLWPYLVWSLVFYLMLYLFWRESFTPFGYIKNLLVGYPYHFVPLIAFYYLLSPFLIPLARRLFSGLLLLVVVALYQTGLIVLAINPNTFGWLDFPAVPVLRSTLLLWAIYFPLGLVYSLNADRILPWLQKTKWVLLAITGVFLVITILDVFSIVNFPFAPYISPVTFVLFLPTLQRNSIPKVRDLEQIGKRSYGLYLSHLIVLNFVLFGIELAVPWLMNYLLLLVPIIFIATMAISLTLMNSATRLPRIRPAYRYVFG